MFDQYGQRKYLNRAERLAFLRQVIKEADKLRRAFCLTLLFSGCRISEALGVRVCRVDISDKAIIFETLKQRQRGKFRSVPMPPKAIALLKELIQGLKGGKLLWPYSRTTAYRLIKHHMNRAGIVGNRATPRGLRHAYGVAHAVNKTLATTLQQWMGHARIETTNIYLQVMGEEAHNIAKPTWLGW